MNERRAVGRYIALGLTMALVFQVQGAAPVLATGGSPFVRIHEARADLQSGQLVVRGENFVRTSRDEVNAWLSGEALAIISDSASEIVAQLPAGIEAGTYRLVVVRGEHVALADAMDVTVGTVGPQGATGETGPKGDRGDTGPPGMPGEKGDKGDKGERGDPGAKGLAWKGAWDPAAAYIADEAVSHDGASWIARRASLGAAPVEGLDWTLVAARGEKGETGERGSQGEAGPTGLQGVAGAKGEKGDRGDKGEKGDTGAPGAGTVEELADLLARLRNVERRFGFPAAVKGFGGDLHDSLFGAALDASGNLFVTGVFAGTVDVGGGPLTSAGSNDAFVAKFSGADLSHVWSRRLGGPQGETGLAVAVDSLGDVFVTGVFQGTADFGGGPLVSADDPESFTSPADIFLAKYSGTDGAHLWSRRLGGAGRDEARGLAVDAGRNVVLAGSFEGTASFGGATFTSFGSQDGLVAKYAGMDGTHLWSNRFGAGFYDEGRDVVVDVRGDVVAVGRLGTSSLESDTFVVKYSAVGSQTWSRRPVGTGNHHASAVAVDSNRDVIVAGSFLGEGDFGGSLVTSAGVDMFLYKYTADGTSRWSRAFGSTAGFLGSEHPFGIAVDSHDDIVVTGSFEFTADFGGGPLSSAGLTDIFVARYAGFGGSHLSSQRFGGPDHDYGLAVAVNAAQGVFVGGQFGGSADFASVSLASAGLSDAFVLRWQP